MARKRPTKPTINSWPDFATAVRKWRTENGKTQAEFATDIGVSQPLIVQVEKGEPVSPLNVQRIAKKLAVDAKALLETNQASAPSFAYCGSTRCPNLRLASNEGELFIVPFFHAVKKACYDSCPFCDSPMYRACPECSQPIREKRSVCPLCHERFVQIPSSLRGLTDEELREESDAWDNRNQRIRKHLGFE